LHDSSSKLVEIVDILYALYVATSGEVGLSRIKGAINQAIMVIKPNKDLNSNFIVRWLSFNKNRIIDKYLQVVKVIFQVQL